MTWENIVKRKQIKSKKRKKPQTRMSGGKIIPELEERKTDKLEFEDVFQEDMDELAEMTRTDIMDMVMERIGQMSKEELIDMLERTQENWGKKYERRK